MASVIKPKRSALANTPPTTGNIQQYEIAINTADKKIYTRDGTDNILVIGAGNVSGLADVALSSLADTQILSYNAATSKWINIDNYATQTKEIVKNSTGATLTKGTVVYVSGASGSNILVAKAQANSEATSSNTFGILEADIANGASGYCVRSGRLAGLNTSAYTEGDPIYLSPTTAGGFVVGLANKPSAPNHLVYLGVVTRSQLSNGEIQISISNGWELSEIHDVQIGTKASGNTLIYDATAGTWKNANLTAGTDISVTNGAGSITIADTSTLASVTGRGATTSSAVSITNNTASSSTSTGALTVTGGLGVGGNTYIGGIAAFKGEVLIDNATGTGGTVEGGELHFAVGTTGNTLSGPIAIDIYANKLRIFETGGTNRGVYIDLTTAATGVGTNLMSGGGTVTSVSGTGTVAGLSLSGTVTTSGSLTLSGTLSTPVSTINDSTTVGQNLVKLTNPSAITFLRVNADNTVSALDAASFRTAIGAQASGSYLTANQTITLSGDVTGSGSTAITTTLANSGVTIGTYRSVTVDAKGRVTAGTNPTTLSGYGITDAQPLDGDLTAIAALAGTSGLLKKTAADTWTLDTSTYLTSYTETDTLATVTGRGATTATAVSFTNSTASSSTSNGAVVVTGGVGIGGALNVGGNLTVTGNLTINGTTTTVNSTTVTVDDPIFTIGGDTAPSSDDNKDRGIEFRWHNGTVAKVGFFGFDDSTGYLTFIPDATNTSEVFSGTAGDIQATNFRGALVGNADTATKLATARTINGVSFDGSANITVTTAGTGISVSGTTVTNAGVLSVNGNTGTITGIANASDTHYIGTTAVTLNRASANLALTGISSVTLPGSTSGSVQIIPTAAAGTGTVLTLPATTGTVVTTGDTGTVTNTMLAGSIANAKLANSTISGISLGSNLNTLTIGTGLSGTSYNGSSAVTIANTGVLSVNGNTGTITGIANASDTHYIGTTAVTLNRASANLALTGISSVTLPGSTSGSVQIIPTATAGTGTVLTLPATTGTVVTTGDTGTVTNTMLAGSIATSKITGLATSATTDTTNAANISSGTLPLARLSGITTTQLSGTAGITNAQLANSSITVNGTAISLGGSATIKASTTNVLTIGTGLGGVSFDGSSAVTITNTGVTSAVAGTDTTVSSATGAVTINNTSTLATVTGRGATTATAISLTNATASSSTSTGALVVTGGVGIGGAVNIGGAAAVTGNITINGVFRDATSGGTVISDQNVAQTTVATTTATAIDTWAIATYRSAKYVVQITQGTNYQVSEILVLHNGTTTTMTEYAVLETNGALATITSDISSTNARLLVTMGSATSATINIQRVLMVV